MNGAVREGVACGCCGRGADEADVKRLLPGWKHYGLPEEMCSDCLYWWRQGIVDPASIAERVFVGAVPTPEAP